MLELVALVGMVPQQIRERTVQLTQERRVFQLVQSVVFDLHLYVGERPVGVKMDRPVRRMSEAEHVVYGVPIAAVVGVPM